MGESQLLETLGHLDRALDEDVGRTDLTQGVLDQARAGRAVVAHADHTKHAGLTPELVAGLVEGLPVGLGAPAHALLEVGAQTLEIVGVVLGGRAGQAFDHVGR